MNVDLGALSRSDLTAVDFSTVCGCVCVSIGGSRFGSGHDQGSSETGRTIGRVGSVWIGFSMNRF